MSKHTINSQDRLSDIIGLLRQTFKDKKWFEVTINTSKGRTISQNSISHAWYKQVADELREHTPGEIKCLCKYHFGLPILRGDDPEYNDACAKVIDPLPYEDKIKAMEFWPVTSLMKTKQLSDYMEHVQKNYIGRVELTFPDDA